MVKLKRCRRCLLPSSLVGISFNKDGVCNYCIKYENDFKDWEEIKKRKETEFQKILSSAQKLKRAYDCLIPLSGGKDSTYALYLCSKVYKLKTIAVTLDNGFLSNPAKENIKNALKHCNADHIYYNINRSNSNLLFKTFIEKTGDFCSACMRGINYVAEITVKCFNIPLVISGSGRRVEYVSQIKEVSNLHTASYFEKVINRTNAEILFKHFSSQKYKSEFQKIIGGIADIFKIPRTMLMHILPQYVGLYDYIYSPYTEIIEIIKKEMGWGDTPNSYEHLDCELHNIPFYNNTLRIKNITKNTFYRSGLIRQGLITREEALKEEETEMLNNETPIELLEFLKANKMTFNEYTNRVKYSDKTLYEPKFQRVARNVYYKFRRF